MLPIGGEDSELLGDKFQVRYSATPGLAFHPTGIPATNRTLAIASDKFFAPRDPELNEATVQSIADAVTDSLRIPEQLEVPTSLLADKAGHLIVAGPVTPNMKLPFTARHRAV